MIFWEFLRIYATFHDFLRISENFCKFHDFVYPEVYPEVYPWLPGVGPVSDPVSDPVVPVSGPVSDPVVPSGGTVIPAVVYPVVVQWSRLWCTRSSTTMHQQYHDVPAHHPLPRYPPHHYPVPAAEYTPLSRSRSQFTRLLFVTMTKWPKLLVFWTSKNTKNAKIHEIHENSLKNTTLSDIHMSQMSRNVSKCLKMCKIKIFL